MECQSFERRLMKKLLTPNRVTLLRVIIAAVAVALYASPSRTHAVEIGCAAIALTLIAVLLDGVDGYVARRFRLATPMGAQLDILGDRVLENLFFTAFAVAGLTSLWVPLTFFVRGALTDFLRGLAAERESIPVRGVSAFRRNWFLENPWSKAIVASRLSRAAYGAVKCLCFCVLGAEWTARRTAAVATSSEHLRELHYVAAGIVALTIAFCLIRAIPVVIEGRRDVMRAARPSAMPQEFQEQHEARAVRNASNALHISPRHTAARSRA
jgi:phosphatidylglycerophosphate synthase